MKSPLRKFLTRSRRGVAALVESAAAATAEPERAGYLAAGGLGGGAGLLGWRGAATALRLALPPLLAGTVLRSSVAAGDKAVLLAGLGAGWVGDWDKARRLGRPSAVGIAGVTGQHLAYSLVLLRRGARLRVADSPVESGLRLALWAAGIGLAASGGDRSKGGGLVPAATIPGLMVSGSAALAQDPSLQTQSVASLGLDHGENLILAAEGLTLLRASACHDDGLIDRVLDAGTTTTATIGHLLLVDGLVRS